MLQLLSQDPATFILIAIALILALSFHEAAHAYIARRLGDPTAEHMGRLTLNPLAHLDPLGTLLIFFVGVGWAKPVPVNPGNFRDPALDNLKVALAGPASNLILALFFAGLNYIFQPQIGSAAYLFTTTVIWLNLSLMFFNLIPIPPLDGSKILGTIMDFGTYMYLEQYGTYFLIGLLALSYAGFPVLQTLIFTPARFVFGLLMGTSAPLF